MIKILIADSKEKIKQILSEMLEKSGNTSIYLKRSADVVEIMEKEDIKKMVTLEEKVLEVEKSIYSDKQGVLYETVLRIIERPMIEYVLERTEGNQLKAAKVLGINRNTFRKKMKSLGIDARKWKN